VRARGDGGRPARMGADHRPRAGDPLEDPLGKLAGSYPGSPPSHRMSGRSRWPPTAAILPLDAASSLDGLRAAVVDVDVPRAQTIGIALKATTAAVVVVGGKVALTRSYDLGGDAVFRRATAEVSAGRTRVVVRVAQNADGSHVELDLVGADGKPLVTRAPAPGEAATAAASRADEVDFANDARAHTQPPAPADGALLAAAYLAENQGRTAEHLLEQTGLSTSGDPLAALLYARAVDRAGDLPENRVIERERDAYEQVQKGWPNSWEATLGHAQLTGRRRGSDEGRIETLREVREARAKQPHLDPIVRAFESALASEARLLDEAKSALGEVRPAFAGTPVAAELDDVVNDRIGQERERYACAEPGLDRSSLDCLDAKVSRGDRRGALGEIARLRALSGSPSSLRAARARPARCHGR